MRPGLHGPLRVNLGSTDQVEAGRLQGGELALLAWNRLRARNGAFTLEPDQGWIGLLGASVTTGRATCSFGSSGRWR